MPRFDAGQLEVWDPSLFPYDDRGAAGICRFAPNCGGITYGDPPRTSRPDHPTCPGAPAEFAERLGMDEATAESGTGASAEQRFMAICRARAVRRFGLRDVRITETGA